MLGGNEREVCVDYFGKFENIESEYLFLSSKLGVNTDLSVLRQGRNNDYRAEYTDKMVDIIGNIYRRDAEVFGYSFE